jgi:hypothetical protein
MKFVVALAFLAVCQAKVDIPVAVTAAQVTCDETSITFAGAGSNFPRYAGGELTIGAGCALGDDFSVTADFNACGLVRSVNGDLVRFTGVLASAAPSGMITRRKPISLTIGCDYNRKTAKTAGASVAPVLGEIRGDLGQAGATVDLFLNLLDGEGEVVASGNDLQVEVAQEVTAVVGGANLGALGLNAYATSCYATPSSDAADATKYDLIKDNCMTDPTVEVASSGNGQSISFESFAFSSDVNAQVFLHCDLVACEPDAGCGVCASRKRRSLTFGNKKQASASKRVTTRLY